MPRHTLRRRYSYRRPLKTQKYSSETVTQVGQVTLEPNPANATTVAVPIVAPTSVGGMRKVKNFTIRFQCGYTAQFQIALVYVPEGTSPSNIAVSSNNNIVNVYEPNQNVIAAGICTTGQNNATSILRTRLARNLNSGDSIFVVIRQLSAQSISSATTADCYIMVNYAITY